jgi:hypothetical protein
VYISTKHLEKQRQQKLESLLKYDISAGERHEMFPTSIGKRNYNSKGLEDIDLAYSYDSM